MSENMKEILGGVVVLIGMLATAWVYIDSNYARADTVQQIEQESVKTFQDFRRSLVAEELNYIYEKRSHETYEQPAWERAREQKLKLLWDTYTPPERQPGTFSAQ